MADGVGSHEQAGGPAGDTFEIWLVWSDVRLPVPPERTALAVLTDAGIPVEPGCLTGGCGECAMEYVDGEVDHKDSCLTPEDRRHLFCPCVSRARGTLALPF